MTIHEMPAQERPRERLAAQGDKALSNRELLAICLGSGTKGKSVLDLAEELLIRFQGLRGLLHATVEELSSIKGIGTAKALQLRAHFALALRLLSEGTTERISLNSAEEAYRLLRPLFYEKKQEALALILRDVKGRVFKAEIIAEGTLTEVLMHPREVFHFAVRHKAKSFILAHNHPSGDPTPSPSDIRLTNTLIPLSHMMDIRLDDHLILGEERFISLKEIGVIKHTDIY